MSRFAVIFAFATMAAGAAVTAPVLGADEPGLWFKKFESEEGRYSVEIPGKIKQGAIKAGEGMKEYAAVGEPPGGERVFWVSYLDFKPEGLRGRPPQALMKTYRDGLRKDKTIEADKEITLGDRKVPGRDYRLQAEEKFFVRERLYWDGIRCYRLYVGSPDKGFLDSKAANRFFDSFKIVDAKP
jgi:hypothetical protein